MPFASKKQMRWMFATKPAMAKEWADKTPNSKGLPLRANHPAVRHAVSKRLKGHT